MDSSVICQLNRALMERGGGLVCGRNDTRMLPSGAAQVIYDQQKLLAQYYLYFTTLLEVPSWLPKLWRIPRTLSSEPARFRNLYSRLLILLRIVSNCVWMLLEIIHHFLRNAPAPIATVMSCTVVLMRKSPEAGKWQRFEEFRAFQICMKPGIEMG